LKARTGIDDQCVALNWSKREFDVPLWEKSENKIMVEQQYSTMHECIGPRKYIVFMAATMSEKERSNQLATIFQKRSVADYGLI